MQIELSRTVAKKVLDTVDAGLVKGVGDPVAGHMCVEAAVCFAFGLPHGDNPSCVGSSVRAFKIALNDKAWSSDAARAKGMRRVAIAQLGSDQIDQSEFRKEVAFQTIRQIVPIALRAAAKLNPAYAGALEICAVACEAAADMTSARAAASAAQKKALTVSAAADAAGASAYAAAGAAYAAAYAADAAEYAAEAAHADARSKMRDSMLGKAAEIAVQALIKLKCQGCEWLDLCDEVAKK